MTPLWWSRPLEVGDSGPDVEVVQRRLGLRVTGLYDVSTSIAVRGLQKAAGLMPDGVVDAETAQLVGEPAAAELLPQWYQGQPLFPGEQAYALVLGGRDEMWLRRFQGDHGVKPTGVIDETTARLLNAALAA